MYNTPETRIYKPDTDLAIFHPKVALGQPADSKFFLGESVFFRRNSVPALRHPGVLTVCDISERRTGWYGLWKEGVTAGPPTYRVEGIYIDHAHE